MPRGKAGEGKRRDAVHRLFPSTDHPLPSIASRGMSTMEREKEGSTEKALIDSADRSKEQGSVSSLGIGPIFVPTLQTDTFVL